MADLHGVSGQTQRPARPTPTTTNPSTTFLTRLHGNSPNSTRVIGFLTLIITGAVFLLLAGVTISTTVLGLIFFSPLLLISSPIWVPVGALLFVFAAGVLCFCGFGVVVAVALSWVYKYFTGSHPFGSDRVDYARTRIADTASQVKDYAREYGGYLQSKVKDAAPGA
ncbi:hypothetical protein RHSIM_RhsimUnG0106300 [Rhododendron simsii]|uniref:Oleosin n=1 Tax=Rhododendron simsii TaxID=118357 RepID=A0A834G1I8_RHOSS|nr:hypothetical protein RHSIM_RhsimUnG0106300 [Rhododendron simsii]